MFLLGLVYVLCVIYPHRAEVKVDEQYEQEVVANDEVFESTDETQEDLSLLSEKSMEGPNTDMNGDNVWSSVQNVEEVGERFQRPCYITIEGMTFDLNTVDGKVLWKERIYQQLIKQNLSKTCISRDEYTIISAKSNENTTKENTIESLDLPNDSKYHKQSKATRKLFNGTEPLILTRKARTDVNIRDPSKPVPSVLDHPLTDKKGRPLRRIFIPGRGWVSAKALELEKQELILEFNNSPQLKPSIPLNY